MKNLACFCLSAVLIQAAVAADAKFTAKVTVSLTNRIGLISPYIYGQYLEHVQREDECIYPSLWDKSSPFADEFGLRQDVMAAARELRVPVVRWPGGCFADVYHWRDGIGADRPIKPNLHWGGMEPNLFGTDEFLRWCKTVGCAAYINVNLGTGTLNESLDWLKYCNATNQRVQFWGIGNETFAKWEAGHMDAATYARTLVNWASATRATDPRVKIMAVGSMSADDPAWDQAVLQQAGHLIDFLTLHAYGYSTGATNEFEAVAFTPVYFEQRLRKMVRAIDAFSGRGTNAEPICIAMDEWNIRHHQNGKLNRSDPRTLQDAVFVAGVLNSMIRLSPRVAMANYVFLVNGNGVMLVNRQQVVRTSLFHIFQQYGNWMQGEALDVSIQCPVTRPPMPQAHSPKHKPPPDFQVTAHPWLDAASALRPDGTLALSIVNRHSTAVAETSLQLPKGFKVLTTWTMSDPDILAANTFEQPERLMPQVKKVRDRSTRKWSFPPHSVSLLLCQRK